MVCKNCGTDFKPRKGGRTQEYCPGGDCKAEYRRKRWALGGQAIERAASAKTPRKPRTNYRRNERELWGLGLL
jgi:hypothetical protein